MYCGRRSFLTLVDSRTVPEEKGVLTWLERNDFLCTAQHHRSINGRNTRNGFYQIHLRAPRFVISRDLGMCRWPWYACARFGATGVSYAQRTLSSDPRNIGKAKA